jgi:hypothetical protein
MPAYASHPEFRRFVEQGQRIEAPAMSSDAA